MSLRDTNVAMHIDWPRRSSHIHVSQSRGRGLPLGTTHAVADPVSNRQQPNSFHMNSLISSNVTRDRLTVW